MEMLNKLLNYSKYILRGIFFLLIIMSPAQVMTMGKDFDVEAIEEYNPYGNQMIIQTQDEDFVTVGAEHLDYYQTLTNAFNDTDTSNVLDIPVTTKSYALLTPFCQLAEELTTLKIKKIGHKQTGLGYQEINELLQEKKEIIMHLLNNANIIELLNTMNYLGCSTSSFNQLLNILKSTIETNYESDSTKTRLDNILLRIVRFDIPDELSVNLGRKFIEHYTFSKSYNLIQDVIGDKNVETYALSSDKKYCSYVENGEVKIADIVNKRDVAQIDLDAPEIRGNNINSINLRFSPDGTRLAIALTLENNQSIVFIYSLDELKNSAQKGSGIKLIRTIQDSSEVGFTIINISFSPCSKKLLISGANKEVIHWNLNKSSYKVYKDNGPLTAAFVVYDKEGKKVEDRLNQYRAKFGQLLYRYNGLYSELCNLKAEYVFLFVQIIKNVVDTGKFNLPMNTDTKACYADLMTNPIIGAAIKELTSKKSSCVIS